MGLIKASEWNAKAYEWLIPGLIGNEITLISGEPKTGKSLLAGHLVNSLITQQPILERVPKSGIYKVAWMGFDSNWDGELQTRFPLILENLYFHNPIIHEDKEGWESYFQLLVSSGINLFVLDHLYGLAYDLDLDRSHFMEAALKPLNFICNQLKIPALLIAHANKSGGGRAAHSILLEAKARHFIRIKGNVTGSKRDLILAGNHEAGTSMKINLTPEVCEIISGSGINKSETRRSERSGVMIEIAKKLLLEAPLNARRNVTAAGVWAKLEGYAGTEESGRTLINRMIDGRLLARAEDSTREVIAGPSLIL